LETLNRRGVNWTPGLPPRPSVAVGTVVCMAPSELFPGESFLLSGVAVSGLFAVVGPVFAAAAASCDESEDTTAQALGIRSLDCILLCGLESMSPTGHSTCLSVRIVSGLTATTAVGWLTGLAFPASLRVRGPCSHTKLRHHKFTTRPPSTRHQRRTLSSAGNLSFKMQGFNMG